MKNKTNIFQPVETYQQPTQHPAKPFRPGLYGFPVCFPETSGVLDISSTQNLAVPRKAKKTIVFFL